MTSRHPTVSVKTITDYHLESFIRCPYKFYYQHVLSLNTSQVKWRQIVQFVINQIVKGYYQLPPKEQNKFNLFKLINKYWLPVHPTVFESKIHYYTILAKTTDHLLQFLPKETLQKPPLFMYQKLTTYIKDLQTRLSVTFEIAEWTAKSFTVKKYLVEADAHMLQLYQYLIIVFSHIAFGKLPEKIEIITLLEGKKYTFTATKEHIEQGMEYLKYMKELLQRPEDYAKTNTPITECWNCPFTKQCHAHSDNIEIKMNHLFH